MTAKLDARGLSCPQPVMMTRKALQEAAGREVVILLDSVTQVQNCTRAAEKLGWQASCQEKAGEFELTLRK